MGQTISTAPPYYTQAQAHYTFNDAIQTGRSILGFDNPLILQDYEDYYGGTNEHQYQGKMSEELLKYSYFTDNDQKNYFVARRLIEETAHKILNAYRAAEATAAFAEGNLSGQWPPIVYIAYNNVINGIYNDFYSKVNQVKSQSDGSGRDGSLIWESAPEAPTPPTRPQTQPSPIILDLDGDGVETIDIADGVYFDHDGNRFAEKSGWAGADDALLFWDRNKNGQVDNGGELFGDNSTLSGGKKAANGFQALAEFDSNGDGVVDKNDERWSELALWQDKDGDAVLDVGEMLTLEEAGVTGLNVAYANQNYTDENGNQHKQTGSFIREDGTTGQMTDVWFKADLSFTVMRWQGMNLSNGWLALSKSLLLAAAMATL